MMVKTAIIKINELISTKELNFLGIVPFSGVNYRYSDLPLRSGLKHPNLPDHNRPLNELAT
jgi:hypothetical protein